jgi:GAF domain-containing protein
MRRRSRASSKPTKARSRKTAAREPRNAPAIAVRRGSATEQETEFARVIHERDQALEQLSEAVEQQTATSEVLRVISASPAELGPVFDTVLENATRLCEAHFGILYRFEDDAFRAIALRGAPPAFAKFQQSGPIRPTRVSGLGRIVSTRRPVHITDAMAQQHYIDGDPYVVTAVKLSGSRTLIFVPMLKNDELIGSIAIYRREVRPFTEKQIALLQSFAAQAVIAIENARLLNELRQRTTDLTESLEQQTATSEVLKVISSSPGDLQPVFDAMLANATRLCEAKFGTMYLYDGEAYRAASMYNAPRAFAEYLRRGPVHPGPGTGLDRIAKTKQLVHLADITTEQAYIDGNPLFVAAVEAAGYRTVFLVPMLKEGQLIGAIAIYRQEVRAFTDKQIALVQNFAAQAVIAIENTRLLGELREALENQTTSADILRTIASSPASAERALHVIAETTARRFGASNVNIRLLDGDVLRFVGSAGPMAAHLQTLFPEGPVDANVGSGKAILERRQIYFHPDSEEMRMPRRAAGIISSVATPLMREGQAIGVLIVMRSDPRPFTESDLAQLSNFASQAVIAIENTRLLNELRESLQQQTATADVLKVISRSTFELQTVLNTLTESATRLCAADRGAIMMRDGEVYRVNALYGYSPEAEQYALEHPIRPDRGSGSGRAVLEGKASHIPDVLADPEYTAVGYQKAFGFRTNLSVPLLRDGTTIGVLALHRHKVNPFTDKQIELATTFADQAVIAIENARLFEAEQQRTRELAESLEQQTATSEVLRVISSSPSELGPVFQTMLANATRLCGANFGILHLYEGGAFPVVAMCNVPVAFAQLRTREPLVRPGPNHPLSRVAASKAAVQIADYREDEEYLKREPTVFRFTELTGARTMIMVPMLKEKELVGTISIYRTEVRFFTEKQIALVQNFAAQAVIAIENTRLLNELRQSLQQQTATADVLKVISRSTFDLQAVLDTLVQSAARLCDAESAAIHRPQGNSYPYVASYGLTQEYDEYMRKHPLGPGRGTVLGRAVTECKPVQVSDVEADPEYTLREGQKLGGFRTVVGIPLLREGVPIGVIMLTRNTVRPFTDKQIELATTFADQAAIAIENVRLFDEIQDKSRQLEEVSQHKSQFLANMSHELRTPLNAILGYTELMADGAYGEPSEKMLGILKRLEANGKHLLGLINDVLDLSKIEAGQLLLELSDYCIQDIAQTVRSTLEPLATDKKLGFNVEVAPQLPPGRGDGRRLTQVLINLVGNAIKFTDTGEIAIKAESAEGQFRVSVRDTGPGISTTDQAKLFQEFQQADNAITRKKGGTGLGLAISKRIIEMHGGRIWVESQPGQGSTFAFTLPVIVERQVEAA